MTIRICIYCKQAGMECEFPNGNSLRKHMQSAHPFPKSKKEVKQHKLKELRKQTITKT